VITHGRRRGGEMLKATNINHVSYQVADYALRYNSADSANRRKACGAL